MCLGGFCNTLSLCISVHMRLWERERDREGRGGGEGRDGERGGGEQETFM